MVALPLRDPEVLLLLDARFELVEHPIERLEQVPVEMLQVVHLVIRREPCAEGPLRLVPLRFVLDDVQVQEPRRHEVADPPHRLLDHVVDLVVHVRLLLEPADLHEEALPLPEPRSEFDQVRARDDADGFVVLHDDEARDPLLGHHDQPLLEVGVRLHGHGRTHDALDEDLDRVLLPPAPAALFGVLRPREHVGEVLKPDDPAHAAGRPRSGAISGAAIITCAAFVEGWMLLWRAIAPMETMPTSFFFSTIGISWTSFDRMRPRISERGSSGVPVTTSRDMKSRTFRSRSRSFGIDG